MIISRGNTQILDAPVTASAVHKATLMKEDYIRLSFVDVVDYGFKAGDYVTHEGQEYFLNKDYIPTMKDEATYSYDLQFNAPWYNLDNYIFFFNTYTIEGGEETITKRESEWYITDTASNIINLLIRNTQDAERDCPCKFESVFYCEGTTVKTFTFSSTSILAALNNMANEFELEWWVEVNDGKYYLHFGECDDSIVTDASGSVVFNPDGSRKKGNLGNSRTLTTGTRVGAPSISNKNDLKKKYYVYGSSRNIDQTVDMLSQEDGTYVSSLVTKRLAMEGNPQSHESNPTIITEDIGFGEEVVIFDDIYPRSDWQVTHVSSIDIKTDEIDHYDEDDEPVYKEYKAYNIRLGSAHKEGETWVVDNPNGFSDYVFDLIQDDPDVQNIRDVIASGKELSLKFIIKDVDNVTYTPILSGFEFELGAFLNVNIHGEFPDKSEDYEWYEFQIIKQEINGYVIPNQNLIPQVGDWVCLFNIKGKYIDANQVTNAQTELTEAFKKYYKNLKKDVAYTVKPYVNTVLDLKIGDAVLLRYGYPFNTVRSRISSYEKKLDYKIDASYTISSYVQPSTVNQLKEEVKTITANIASGRALQLDSEAINSMLNVYGKKMFLSKTQDDEASGKITLQKGAYVNTTIGTPTFIGGFAGSGWQVDSGANLTVDSLTVRKTMRIFELLIQQVRATGGEIIVTPANGKVKQVIEHNDEVRPTYELVIEDGLSSAHALNHTMFKAGDFVRCQKWMVNLSTYKYYWVRIVRVQDSSIFVYQSAFSGSVPEVGDELVLFGSTDTNRQSAITISAAEDGTPKITILNGINASVLASGDLTGCTRVVLGDLNDITDSDFTGDNAVSGYGLYSDNVFLKGKLAFPNGTLISDDLTEIRSGKITLSGETTVNNDFFVKNLETIPTQGNAKIKASGSLMEISGMQGNVNIRFGIDENTGYPVMQYWNNAGQLLYDLGPNGITSHIVVTDDYFTSSVYQLNGETSSFTVYLFSAKRINGIITGGTWARSDEAAAAADGKYYTQEQTMNQVSDANLNLVTTSPRLCHLVGEPVYGMNANLKPLYTDQFTEAEAQAEIAHEVEEQLGITSGVDYNLTVENDCYVLLNDIHYQHCFVFTSGVRSYQLYWYQ